MAVCVCVLQLCVVLSGALVVVELLAGCVWPGGCYWKEESQVVFSLRCDKGRAEGEGCTRVCWGLVVGVEVYDAGVRRPRLYH